MPTPPLATRPRGLAPTGHARPHAHTPLRATWKDYLPRVVDEFSRRVPPPSGTAGAASSVTQGGVDVAGAADAVRRLVFPESVAAPSELTWPVLLFGSLAIGLALEAATLVVKAVSPPEEEGGEGVTPLPPPSAQPSRSTVMPPPAPTVPSAADIAAERARLRDRIVAERYRGLAWLAALTVGAVWSAGLLSGPNALAP